MPNHGHSGAGPRSDGTIKTIMDQAVTGDMFKDLSQRPVNWVDERPSAEEAKDFNDRGPPTATPDAPAKADPAQPNPGTTSESGDAVPQFQQVALASPDTAGQVVYSATADVAETGHADSDVQVAQVDADHAVMHDSGSDAHAADTTGAADTSAAHHVDASATVGEEAAA